MSKQEYRLYGLAAEDKGLLGNTTGQLRYGVDLEGMVVVEEVPTKI
jgi:hypothetical protein